MPVITLPDGSQRHYDHAVSPMDVALDIGRVWRKPVSQGALMANWLMLAILIENDAQLSIITAKDRKVWRSFVTPVRTC